MQQTICFPKKVGLITVMTILALSLAMFSLALSKSNFSLNSRASKPCGDIKKSTNCAGACTWDSSAKICRTKNNENYVRPTALQGITSVPTSIKTNNDTFQTCNGFCLAEAVAKITEGSYTMCGDSTNPGRCCSTNNIINIGVGKARCSSLPSCPTAKLNSCNLEAWGMKGSGTILKCGDDRYPQLCCIAGTLQRRPSDPKYPNVELFSYCEK